MDNLAHESWYVSSMSGVRPPRTHASSSTIDDLVASVLDAGDPPRDVGTTEPWVAANMAASIDGAIEVEGRSAPLSGPADRAVFHALRSLADVIVVGAGTARAEGYRRPAVAAGNALAARRERGQSDAPRLCIVSRSLAFDTVPPALDEPPNGEQPTLVATTASPDDARRQLPHAEVVALSGGDVSPRDVIGALAERSLTRVLVEGGPTLLGAFIGANAVDELNVTIAPMAVAGTSGRMARSDAATGVDFDLDRVLDHESYLFLRYRRSR